MKIRVFRVFFGAVILISGWPTGVKTVPSKRPKVFVFRPLKKWNFLGEKGFFLPPNFRQKTRFENARKQKNTKKKVRIFEKKKSRHGGVRGKKLLPSEKNEKKNRSVYRNAGNQNTKKTTQKNTKKWHFFYEIYVGRGILNAGVHKTPRNPLEHTGDQNQKKKVRKWEKRQKYGFGEKFRVRGREKNLKSMLKLWKKHKKIRKKWKKNLTRGEFFAGRAQTTNFDPRGGYGKNGGRIGKSETERPILGRGGGNKGPIGGVVDNTIGGSFGDDIICLRETIV